MNVLSNSTSPMVRACAYCEQEFGILDRTARNKTHGICRRHFIQNMRDAMIPRARLDELLAKSSPTAFCPDLREARS